MHRWTWCLAGVLCACGPPASTFEFYLSGSRSTHATGTASSSIDNAGALTLDDRTWRLDIASGGIASGSAYPSQITILDKATGDLFTTAVAGSCTVVYGAHGATNGSAVSGTFYCSGLASNTGAVVDVNGGLFDTSLDDTANNPTPPGPPGP